MKNFETFTPERKIGKSHTSLTGRISSEKTDRIHSFESSLERDFIQITDFNPNIGAFVEQPVTIHYLDENDKSRTYVPDFLIQYRNNTSEHPHIKPLLVEIKYRENLKKNWKELKPKFKAAMKYCDERGWKFKILTEVEIRTDYLFNAKFLNGYRNSEDVRTEDLSFLIDKLETLQESTPNELLNVSTSNEKRRAYLIYTLWYAISNNFIGADLSEKLSMNSAIWSNY